MKEHVADWNVRFHVFVRFFKLAPHVPMGHFIVKYSR